jgi:hypothetical protein
MTIEQTPHEQDRTEAVIRRIFGLAVLASWLLVLWRIFHG